MTDSIIREYPREIPKSSRKEMSCNHILDAKLNQSIYNANVKAAIASIIKLKKWDDYIVFNREKYGVSKIMKIMPPLSPRRILLHRENNCMGLVNYENITETLESSIARSKTWAIIGGFYRCEKCKHNLSQ